jgi:hypothetical protein
MAIVTLPVVSSPIEILLSTAYFLHSIFNPARRSNARIRGESLRVAWSQALAAHTFGSGGTRIGQVAVSDNDVPIRRRGLSRCNGAC